MMTFTWHTRRNMREDQIIPPEVSDEPIARGQIHAQLPLLVADAGLHIVHARDGTAGRSSLAITTAHAPITMLPSPTVRGTCGIAASTPPIPIARTPGSHHHRERCVAATAIASFVTVPNRIKGTTMRRCSATDRPSPRRTKPRNADQCVTRDAWWPFTLAARASRCQLLPRLVGA